MENRITNPFKSNSIMAKPSWVTTQPSSGTGNGSVKVSASAYTGRTQRSGSLTYTADGAEDVVQTVSQKGKAEFVTVQNASATKAGGSVTITGKSNSSKLTFALGSGDLTISLPGTYTAAGKSATSGTAISGDPGGSAEFDFSITISVPANGTIAARSRQITVTTAGGQSATSTLTQAAGDPTLSVSPNAVTLEASGEAVTVTVTSNTSWSVE